MEELVCARCGAPLEKPAEADAEYATCKYCGTTVHFDRVTYVTRIATAAESEAERKRKQQMVEEAIEEDRRRLNAPAQRPPNPIIRITDNSESKLRAVLPAWGWKFALIPFAVTVYLTVISIGALHHARSTGDYGDLPALIPAVIIGLVCLRLAIYLLMSPGAIVASREKLVITRRRVFFFGRAKSFAWNQIQGFDIQRAPGMPPRDVGTLFLITTVGKVELHGVAALDELRWLRTELVNFAAPFGGPRPGK